MNNKVTQLPFGLFGSVLVKDEMKGYYDNVNDTKRKESKPQTSHVLLIIKRNLVSSLVGTYVGCGMKRVE